MSQSTPRPAQARTLDDSTLIARARSVLTIEANAVTALAARIDAQFVRAVDIVLQSRGRVIVSGVGKSGHVGRKIAATLASTGTPAYFVHPAEAAHGDLGMIQPDDILIALSNSGSTEELLVIVPFAKRMGARLIAMTGRADSPLAQLSDVHLDVGVAEEACSLNLAPTASTTAALAMGDALAVVLLDARGFSPEDFARSHPGGALGRRLLTHVRDVMRSGDAIPFVTPEASFADALLEISRKGMGMTAICDVVNGAPGKLLGVFTDGDLRRLLERTGNITGLKIAEVMHTSPRCITPDALAAEAATKMEQLSITRLLVIDAQGILVGALNTQDLLTAKVI
ncbi:KpsF/GutQ family sugar-phosphate isomerase [Uliginosibacterium sp. H3]|uniref:KpsF/GutQ family sugar-phosphate isomerase n=1 Tax=Uliginosibacterium silvisoli TaxID=3114758 RepID=A0ABU6K606_9RHOO|nr:KpsF/GutQ family sugar-phosphate isomerase [Uliginosibacterium sp. H3]